MARVKDSPLMKTLKSVLILLPSVLAMYALYMMEKLEVWTAETLFRDFMTICIMTAALGTSFLIFSRLFKK